MKCTKCEIEKSLNMFRKRNDTKKGYRCICKDCECFKKYNRGYLGKNGNFCYKSIEYDNNTKLCTICNKIKDFSEFEIKSKLKNKRRSWCFSCDSIKKKCKEYNISKEDYIKMLHESNNKCSICGNPNNLDRELYTDHCHKTNKVRGLLCQTCNSGLGMFKDNILILQSAIEYLRKNF